MGKGEGTGGGTEEVVWIKLAKTSVVSDGEREAHLAWFDAAGVGGKVCRWPRWTSIAPPHPLTAATISKNRRRSTAVCSLLSFRL